MEDKDSKEKKRVRKIIQCLKHRKLIREDGSINMNKCRDVRNSSQAGLKVEKGTCLGNLGMV